jgi:hypothetical protein
MAFKSIAFTLATLSLSSTVTAATLLGTGTLDTVDDLTIIQTSSGQVLEWLDLSATAGMTVEVAEDMYQADGFAWATGNEVAELYDAFNISYSAFSSSVVDLNVDDATAQNYINYLGITDSQNGSMGWLDDLTTTLLHTYSCISVSSCNPDSFVYNTVSYWPDDAAVGVFLVRVVPIPAAVWLFGSGLIGLIGIARRKKS